MFMRSLTGPAAGAAIMALAFVPAGCTYPGGAVPTQARAEPPPTDCRAWVGVDRNHELPGYLLPQPGGRGVAQARLLGRNYRRRRLAAGGARADGGGCRGIHAAVAQRPLGA